MPHDLGPGEDVFLLVASYHFRGFCTIHSLHLQSHEDHVIGVLLFCHFLIFLESLEPILGIMQLNFHPGDLVLFHGLEAQEIVVYNQNCELAVQFQDSFALLVEAGYWVPAYLSTVDPTLQMRRQFLCLIPQFIPLRQLILLLRQLSLDISSKTIIIRFHGILVLVHHRNLLFVDGGDHMLGVKHGFIAFLCCFWLKNCIPTPRFWFIWIYL